MQDIFVSGFGISLFPTKSCFWLVPSTALIKMHISLGYLILNIQSLLVPKQKKEEFHSIHSMFVKPSLCKLEILYKLNAMGIASSNIYLVV